MNDQQKKIERAKWHIDYFKSTISRLEFRRTIAMMESPPDVAGSYDLAGIEMKLDRCRKHLENFENELKTLEK